MRKRIVLLFAASLLGCSKKAPAAKVSDAAVQTSATDPRVDASVSAFVSADRERNVARPADGGAPLEFTGVIRGVVKLAPGAKLPFAPFPRQNGITPPSLAPCPAVDASDQKSTVSRAKQTGGLFPVHVALTGMTGFPPREPQTHDVFIDGCRMRPTLVAAMRGDRVRITNRSDTPLIPKLPGTNYMRGLIRGEASEGPLLQARTVVECSFGSYCGEALVVALKHTLYAVTTPEGFFTISKVPLDEDLKVHAWNPLFEVSSKPFRLSHEHPEETVELLLTPTAAARDTKLGPPPPAAPPKVIVHRLPDGGLTVDSPGPAYE